MNEMIEKTTLAYCRIFPELKDDYLTTGDDTIINIVVEKVIERNKNNSILDVGSLKTQIKNILNSP